MKRLFAILLAVAMVFSCLPLTTFAATEVASGTCGNDVTWTFTDDGVLTISGTGAMTDYSTSSIPPWRAFYNDIKKVVIDEGVTTVGDHAFFYCGNLTSAELPDSVTVIGVWAFNGCGSLADITIPGGVTAIGEQAFYNCESLTSITIPGSVTTIGYRAFRYCTGLTDLTISTGVSTIGADAFSGCSGLENITIPASVTTIGDGAFGGCENLTEITIPEGVTSIGNSVFSGCDSLAEINVAENNKNYSSDSNGVLFNKNKTELLQAPGGISGHYTVTEGVTSIGDYAFYGCSSLTNVTIPDTVTAIGDRVFYNSGIATITVPDSVTSIGELAFYYCSSLREITFEGDAPTLGDNAFLSTTATAYYPAGNETWTEAVKQNYGGTITWQAYTPETEGVTWKLENGILTISGTGAMDDYSITSVAPWHDRLAEIQIVKIEDGVTTIGTEAFQNCSNLTEITIADSVQSIGDYAFYNCRKLTGITIPEGVTRIGNYTFSDCNELDDITIPSSVTSIGNYAFSGCKLTTVTLPEKITDIGEFAFSSCEFTTITLPDSVQSLGNGVFNSCDNLASITIPNNIQYLDDGMFDSCTNLTSVTLPNGVQSLGNGVFNSCYSLASITIPDSVTGIAFHAFADCFNLGEIIFLGDAPVFGEDVFVEVIATAYYPAGNATWTDAVKQNYGGTITWTSYTDGPAEVASGTCGENLTWVLTEDGVLTISGTGAMTDYSSSSSVPWYSLKTSITEVVIENGVTSIGEYAFSYCSSLTGITIPDSVTSIGDSAFAGCSSLEEITFEGDAPAFGSGVFTDVTATAYYPAGNDTWTEDVKQNYGGTITWVAYGETTCEHVNVYVPNEDGQTHTVSCFICGDVSIDNAAHSYQEYVCVCGAVNKFDLPNTNPVLQNSLTMNFRVEKTRIGEMTGCYAVITQDTKGDVTKGATVYQSQWTTSGDYYVIPYNGIAAKEMGDDVTAVLYNANGVAISNPKTDSLKDYAFRGLAALKNATGRNAVLRTLLVDMLNYGAQAQTYFGYDAENLVNADLTDTQKAWATQSIDPDYTKTYTGTQPETSLILDNSILMKVAFFNVTEGMYIQVRGTGHSGTAIEADYSYDEMTADPKVANKRFITIDKLMVADHGTGLTVTLYNADGSVNASVTDAVEGYVTRVHASNSTAASVVKLKALTMQLQKFCDAAYAYLHYSK